MFWNRTSKRPATPPPPGPESTRATPSLRPAGLADGFPAQMISPDTEQDRAVKRAYQLRALMDVSQHLQDTDGRVQSGFLHADAQGVWLDLIVLRGGRELWHVQLYITAMAPTLKSERRMDRVMDLHRPFLVMDGSAREFNHWLKQEGGETERPNLDLVQRPPSVGWRRDIQPDGTVDWSAGEREITRL